MDSLFVLVLVLVLVLGSGRRGGSFGISTRRLDSASLCSLIPPGAAPAPPAATSPKPEIRRGTRSRQCRRTVHLRRCRLRCLRPRRRSGTPPCRGGRCSRGRRP